jgi:hypothetical protein
MSRAYQISFRVDLVMAEEIKRAADREDLRIADLVRKIFRHAYVQYVELGSLHALKESTIDRPGYSSRNPSIVKKKK